MSIGPGGLPKMKGKWARGIQPRNFIWVIKDRLAAAEVELRALLGARGWL